MTAARLSDAEWQTIVRYCAEEVDRQRDRALAVWWMLQAWLWALENYDGPKGLTLAVVEHLGRMVHPVENARGFRLLPVRVGSRRCPEGHEIPGLLASLFTPEALTALPPEEVYRRFEEIHPFADGNGRTGKIILNWLAGTLRAPIMPPNFWHCANP